MQFYAKHKKRKQQYGNRISTYYLKSAHWKQTNTKSDQRVIEMAKFQCKYNIRNYSK